MTAAKTQGKRALAAAVLVFACAIAAAPARADDSTAEVAIGGLTLTKTDAISIDSEDLYISRDIVRVKYRFTNTTDSPIDALVAFPLPDNLPGLSGMGNFWSDPSKLKFKTRVDGRPLALRLVVQAFFKGKDVSARLSALHIPLNPDDLYPAIYSVRDSDRGRLVGDGLIREVGDYWAGQWTLRTTATSHQTFPPRMTITVEHEYVPQTSTSPYGSHVGLTEPGKYCIDDPWIHSVDEMLEKKGLEKTMGSWATTLGYVLTTGANWKGPIGDFRLVVDKGRPDSLVSFCAEGVTQISPTQHEVRYTNFTPKEDLHILFIDWR